MPLQLKLDRSAKTSLAEQIRKALSTAIDNGVFAPGARLPSWQDLAAQLGVARGTVRAAYEKLSAAQLIVASRAAGTRVADRPRAANRSEQPPDPGSFMEMYQEMRHGPAIFQMGYLQRRHFRPRCSRDSAHRPFAQKRSRRRFIQTLAVNLNSGAKSPAILPSPGASNVRSHRSS